jgi:PAS domain S-box-containing protein
VRRKTRLADGALLALVALLTAVAAFAAWRLYSTAENRYVKEAFPIRSTVRDTLIEMLNEETGVRGYLISGDQSSLQPYRDARAALAGDMAALNRLATRRPEIAADVADAERLTRRLDRFYVQQIALVERGRSGQLEAQRNIFAGKALFDRFRETSNRLVRHANAIVADAHRSQRRTFWTTLAIALAAGTAAAAIALWLLLSVPRRIWSLYDIERDLREQAERGDRAARSLAHVDDAVVLLDPGGTIRYWNNAAQTILDVAEHTAIDRPVDDVIPEFATVEALLERGRGNAVVPITRHGHERWLVIRESRFPEGRVLVFHDVTAERQLERARSEFLATASHELRTPLAAVYGAVRTLRHAERPKDANLDEQLLAMIESESDRLKDIVEQILVSAEIDHGAVGMQRHSVDLRKLCESAISAALSHAPAAIELSLDATNGVTAEADPARLRQVLVNLLDNAIKYSPDGGPVDVTIGTRPGVATIEVADHGIGVPPEAQERIFEKFFRLDPDMTKGTGGSGLGLYISRELVERMNGRLLVRSRADGGSVFTIELPR